MNLPQFPWYDWTLLACLSAWLGNWLGRRGLPPRPHRAKGWMRRECSRAADLAAAPSPEPPPVVVNPCPVCGRELQLNPEQWDAKWSC